MGLHTTIDRDNEGRRVGNMLLVLVSTFFSFPAEVDTRLTRANC